MRAILAAVTAACVLTGCETTTDPQPVRLEATLTGLPGWGHLSGTSVVLWAQGASQFTAAAQIMGDAAGAVRPWHVHHNTCAQGGGIVGEDGDYPRLTVGAGGSASATASVPTALQTGAAYHVNVHLSVGEMETVIACGDLAIVAL